MLASIESVAIGKHYVTGYYDKVRIECYVDGEFAGYVAQFDTEDQAYEYMDRNHLDY